MLCLYELFRNATKCFEKAFDDLPHNRLQLKRRLILYRHTKLFRSEFTGWKLDTSVILLFLYELCCNGIKCYKLAFHDLPHNSLQLKWRLILYRHTKWFQIGAHRLKIGHIGIILQSVFLLIKCYTCLYRNIKVTYCIFLNILNIN